VWSKTLKAGEARGLHISVSEELAPIFGSSDRDVGGPCGKPGGLNDKRVEASETAYGCTGGARL
jgi:hypothetical protein